MRLAAYCVASLLAVSLVVSPARADTEEDRRDRDRPSLGVIVGQRDDRVVIAHVIKDGPADEAGLRRGDEIRRVDGDRVRSARDVLSRVHEKSEGDEVELEVRRDGESKTLSVELITFREAREQARDDDELVRRAHHLGVQAQIALLQRQVQMLERQLQQMQAQQQPRRGPGPGMGPGMGPGPGGPGFREGGIGRGPDRGPGFREGRGPGLVGEREGRERRGDRERREDYDDEES